MSDLLPFLLTFVATLGLEVGIAALHPRWRNRRLLLLVFFANCLTHPIAFTLLEQTKLPWLPLEILITLVETLVYTLVAPMPWTRALSLSVLANFVTASLAWLLMNS